GGTRPPVRSRMRRATYRGLAGLRTEFQPTMSEPPPISRRGTARGAGAGGGTRPPVRSRMRRATYRALADLRTEFQRTMSEPPSISRRATAWWPATVGLEQVMDAVTSVALAVSHGARVPPSGV